MTNREMILFATSILFASTTVGMALQGALHHPRPPFEHDFKHGPEGRNEGHRDDHDRRKGPRPDFFAMGDTNKDGFVTKEEMLAKQQQRLDELFATVDANKDGKLTRDEMEKGRELMHTKMKARFEAERNAAGEKAQPEPQAK